MQENCTCSLQNPRLCRKSRVSIKQFKLVLKLLPCVCKRALLYQILTISLAISRVLWETLCTTPVEVPLLPKSYSETSTNTSNALSISSPLRACTPECSFTVEAKVRSSTLINNYICIDCRQHLTSQPNARRYNHLKCWGQAWWSRLLRSRFRCFRHHYRPLRRWWED